MRYGDAEATLKAMLRERGADARDPLATWATFKEFAAIPVEGVDPDEGDLLLFQWGAYDWADGNGERFEIDVTRQFSILDRRSEYDHMEQLRCTFYYEPTAELLAFGSGERWLPPDLESGFAEVESLPVFGVLRDRRPPLDRRVEQHEV